MCHVCFYSIYVAGAESRTRTYISSVSSSGCTNEFRILQIVYKCLEFGESECTLDILFPVIKIGK